MILSTLLNQYPLISDQVDRAELRVILSALERATKRHPVGAIVEFGCYVGTTSLFIRRLLDKLAMQHEFHVYDSFAGLPAKSQFDQSPAGEQFTVGELTVSKKEFIKQFKRQNLVVPTIHKGWFSQLGDDDVPGDIVFAFLDGDYYDSIFVSLQLITPQLVPGATIVIDDYVNEALPGACLAADKWAKQHGYTIRVQQSLGIIHLK
jgi:O-methyltransferase